jgi:hypothetical protein
MAFMDLKRFQFKRVNAFQGLVIDADIWQDAHNYHRDQQRLHTLAFHKTGITEGLEVIASNPPDSSVNISPGMAVDPDGNIIMVAQKQHYRLQTRDKGTIYLVIQFREIPTEPYQPPEGGQPTRIMEAYRIQERESLPAEPYIELARIDFDPAQGLVKDAQNPSRPGTTEINLSFRQNAPAVADRTPEKVVIQPKETVSSQDLLTLGYMSLGESRKDLHLKGLRNLVREVNRQGNYVTLLEEDITLKKSISRYNLLYLTGMGRFELTTEQQTTLNNFVQSGGIIFGDCCSQAAKTDTKGPKEFGLAFNRLANLFNYKLGMVQRGHPLLSADYVFSEVPQGCDPGLLLEGGPIVYSGSDYGCAWEAGHADEPLSREVIRNSFEIWINIITYSRMSKTTKR